MKRRSILLTAAAWTAARVRAAAPDWTRLVGAALEAPAGADARLVRVLADDARAAHWRVERSALPRPMAFIAAGRGALWLAGSDGVLLRVDAASGRALGPPVVLTPEMNGMPLTALAVAADGTHGAAVTDGALLMLDAAGQPLNRIALPSPAAAVAASAVRRSFVVAFAARPELWEIAHDPRAEEFYEGLVHDFRMGEGVPTRGYLNPRRMKLPQPLPALALDFNGMEAWGGTQAVNLDVRRRVADLPVAAAHLGCALRMGARDTFVMPDTAGARLLVFDRSAWQPLASVPWSGPAPPTACAAHPHSPTLWVAADDALYAFDASAAAPLDPRRPLARLALPGPVAGALRFGTGGATLHAPWVRAGGGDSGVAIVANEGPPTLLRQIELAAPRGWRPA